MADQQFTHILHTYPDALADRKRFAGLLKDFMSEQPLQINLLLNLYDIGIHGEIAKTSQINNAFVYRFVKRLIDEYGVSRENAERATTVWCECYGVSILKKNYQRDSKNTVFVNELHFLKSEDIKPANSFISAGRDCTIGLRTDGTVVATGDNSDGKCNVNGWKDIVAISAGDYHTIGLKSNGRVLVAGTHITDDPKDVPDLGNWKDIVSVCAVDNCSFGLKADGTVIYAGDGYSGRCDVTHWKNIISLSAHGGHTVGLKSDGTVVSVGRYHNSVCSIQGWHDIVSISTNVFHTIGLKSDGTVIADGENVFNQCDVQNWENITAISAGFGDSFGVKADGTIICTNIRGNEYKNIYKWKNILSISAGANHIVGVLSDGSVVADGENDFGQCNVKNRNWKNIGLPKGL